MSRKLYCDLSKYDDKLIKILQRNPHTAQFFCTFENSKVVTDNKNINKKRIIVNKDYKKQIYNKNDPYKKYHQIDNYVADMKKYTRKVIPKMPELKYMPSYQKVQTVIHWGQRKLLDSEIEFLTMYHKKGDIVVYAGAAPGTHILILSEMFPKLHFILVDPREFNSILFNVPNITIINGYLNKESAKDIKKDYKNKKILLISDIRTGLDVGRADFPTDEEIYADMKLQQSFYELLDPEWSMFKFRLPWESKTMSYLEGDIYLQIFAAEQSSETRLMVGKNAKKKTYNAPKYDDQLYYFNTITRCQCYDHPYSVEGMDHCYDCYTEFLLLEEYYQKVGNKDFIKKVGGKNKKDFVEKTASYITKVLSEHGVNKFKLKYKINV